MLKATHSVSDNNDSEHSVQLDDLVLKIHVVVNIGFSDLQCFI